MTGAGGSPRDAGTAIEHMLEARSVAVVGASVKEGSLGASMMTELRRGDYEGAVYPVNPGYDEVAGYRCYSAIGDVPEPVDLAILGVANRRVEQSLLDAIAAGARSAVTFSSLYEAEPPDPGAPPLADRIGAIAREHGIALCGGNGMGFMNEEHHLRATGFPTPDDMRHGPVTFVSHSGSAFAALAFNDRGIGFNLIVSSGQEIVSTMADYMEYALGRDSTRVLALLLETVRDPPKFRAQLALAAERNVPVIALKVGRAERAKAMVTAHSGALAGEHGAYEDVFDAYGVLEVASLDEMADTMELLSSPRRVARGAGVASVHDSGGERALFVDLAQDLGVPIAELGDGTLSTIQDVLDEGIEAANPLDAWGTGIDADRIFEESLLAMAGDPAVAAVAFVVDLTRQGEPYDEGYLRVARAVWGSTDVPFCMLSNLASAVAHDEARILRDAGIPVLEGTRTGLIALRHLLADRDFRERPPARPLSSVPEDVRERWYARLGEGRELPEVDALALLADYGIPTVPARAVSSTTDAVAAATDIGFPVVVKTAAPGVQHKSDVGGVKLELAGPEEVRVAYEDLADRLGIEATVAPMARNGVEVALGVVRDPTFGPLVLVAAGGVLVEVLHDRRLALPPLDEDRARRLVDGLRMRPLLDGVRGEPPPDVESLVKAVSRLSALAADLGNRLEALDANPVIVSPGGCVAVDALVIAGR